MASPRTRQSQATDIALAATVSAKVHAERNRLLSILAPVVDVIGRVVGNNVEIVLHDLTRPENSIRKIVNGRVSGRAVGDSILSGPDNDKGFIELRCRLQPDVPTSPSLITDYRTFTRDGRELQSSTVIFRDSLGTPFASLCVNADLTVVGHAHALLQSLLGMHKEEEPVAQSPASPGIDALMREIISDAVRRFGKPVPMMDKEEKIHAVDVMQRRGLFTVKGGVERAAGALGVTRFTIYNYLDALKSRAAIPATSEARVIAPAKRRRRT